MTEELLVVDDYKERILLETVGRGASELTLVLTASRIPLKVQGRANPSMKRTGGHKVAPLARELMAV